MLQEDGLQVSVRVWNIRIELQPTVGGLTLFFYNDSRRDHGTADTQTGCLLLLLDR